MDGSAHAETAPEAHQPFELAETGDARVDEAVSGLTELSGLPTSEHVGVYDEVHRRLQDALADLDGT
jgi:hypothetical protein